MTPSVVMLSVACVCISVCLPSCWGSNFWKPWHRKWKIHLQYAGTFSEYLSQVRLPTSSGQGQCYRSKKRVCVSWSWVVCLRLKDSFVQDESFAWYSNCITTIIVWIIFAISFLFFLFYYVLRARFSYNKYNKNDIDAIIYCNDIEFKACFKT